MNNKPLVSIIVPSYNSRSYVEEAIKSALEQTYKNIEIIVVDDGSTDNTKEVLAPYVASSKIKYIYQANKGLSGARNMGIRAAKGEYVALLDADDIFLPEKIEKQVAYLETHPECDISYCDLHHFWDEEPEKLLKLDYHYYSGADVLPQLLERNFIAPLSVVARRAVFEKYGYFDENLRRSEDLEFYLRLAQGGANFQFLAEPLAKLRMRRTNNLQGVESQPAVKLTMLEVLNRVNARMSDADRVRFRMKHHIMIYRLRIGLAYLLVCKKSEAGKYIREGFQDYPLGSVAGFLFWLPFAVLPANLTRSIIMKVYYSVRESHLKELTTND